MCVCVEGDASSGRVILPGACSESPLLSIFPVSHAAHGLSSQHLHNIVTIQYSDTGIHTFLNPDFIHIFQSAEYILFKYLGE